MPSRYTCCCFKGKELVIRPRSHKCSRAAVGIKRTSGDIKVAGDDGGRGGGSVTAAAPDREVSERPRRSREALAAAAVAGRESSTFPGGIGQ